MSTYFQTTPQEQNNTISKARPYNPIILAGNQNNLSFQINHDSSINEIIVLDDGIFCKA